MASTKIEAIFKEEGYNTTLLRIAVESGALMKTNARNGSYI